ncbi:phosphoethanolamine transferase [Methylobrevis albus]|uniref:Phosphoethanolamine--lipid A transferase n=1 Tax=Methylobrevis albus TaxID=2793297 RepID=A0A931I6K7_9HYPH|nr:phosphoethanolamine--lipid A transferase [Methylobrevis albus]MBH0239743.1 phosphoethanolamine--lipid A transferase [Methylobrevis albus]
MSTFDSAPAARPAARFTLPAVSVELIALAATLLLVFGSNRGFLARFLEGRDVTSLYDVGFIAATVTVLAGLHLLILLVLANRWTVKPLLTLLIAISPVPAYYMAHYGTVFDTAMMRAVVHTDHKEAGELLTPGLFMALAAYAGLPIVVMWLTPVCKAPIGTALRRRLLWIAATLAVILVAGLPFSKDIFATSRNHKETHHMLVPVSVLVATGKALADDGRDATVAKTAIGRDATAATPAAEGRRPRLLVFVVGETARAANWGLNGYARQTTPELAAMPDVVNFPAVGSCGTATEVSLPCMFSPYGRRAYDEDAIRSHESVLNVLDHAGIDVLWRDNQSGCKGVCDGLAAEQMPGEGDPAICRDGRCLDEIMLQGLGARIDAVPGDMIVLLHQLGNHGPAYFERYRNADRVFTPTCDTGDLGSCPVEAVVNSYDNALRYTDHFLAETIAFLKARTDRDTAMLYVSDHGESLGEYGLFLHGMPYAIAPDVQKTVPMVMWVSDAFATTSGLDRACLAEHAQQPTSHDALFHTLLGLMAVKTSLYDRAYDLAASCRPAATG